MKKPKTEFEAWKLVRELEDQFDMHIIVWSKEDVMLRASEREIPITEDECIEVIGLLQKTHDCNYGTTWDTLDACTDDVIRNRIDPRIAEFTARINEATENWCKLIEKGTKEMDAIAANIKINIDHMKTQREAIIRGDV